MGVAVANNQATITGDGVGYNRYIYRAGAIADGQGIHFAFQIDRNTMASNFFVNHGAWGDPGYRQWGIEINGTTVTARYYEGTAHYDTNIGSININSWYDCILVADSADVYRIILWERSNPTNVLWYTLSKPSWTYSDWKFITQVKTGVEGVADYHEFDTGAQGQRSKLTDNGSNVTSWTYDIRGQVKAENQNISGGGNFLTGWAYNSAGMLIGLIYPSGNVGGAGEYVNFNYKPQGAIDSVIGANTYLRSTDYDAKGRMLKQYFRESNASPLLQTIYAYNNDQTQGGRLNRIYSGTSSITNQFLDLTYNYDSEGNINSILDAKNSSQRQCFTYDVFDRLTRGTTTSDSTHGCGSTQYGTGNYDENYYYDTGTGNLGNKAGVSYAYNDANHSHAVTHLGGIQKYWYDANGNMTRRISTDGDFKLYYNGENQLVQVEKLSGGTYQTIASYKYSDGMRISATENSLTTYYIGNAYEWTGSVSTAKKYYYAGAQRVAMRTGTAAPIFIFADHLGSSSRTYDTGSSTYTPPTTPQLYLPFGSLRSGTANALPTDYTFTGQKADSLVGLMYYGARWYDQSLGRWTIPDTIVPQATQGIQAWDRYAYANNNTVKYNDPSGHCIFCVAIVLAIMAVMLTGDTAITVNDNYPINAAAGNSCGSPLPDCFGDQVVLKDFSANGEDNPIPIAEFETFADEAAQDLNSHDLTWPGYSAGRQVYDTPFYNGGESASRTGDPNSEQGFYPADQQVCIETLGCSGRSEINYMAQGMWGAAVGEPEFVSQTIVYIWKGWEYGELPSQGTLYWLSYGYDYYKQWEEEQQK